MNCTVHGHRVCIASSTELGLLLHHFGWIYDHIMMMIIRRPHCGHIDFQWGQYSYCQYYILSPDSCASIRLALAFVPYISLNTIHTVVACSTTTSTLLFGCYSWKAQSCSSSPSLRHRLAIARALDALRISLLMLAFLTVSPFELLPTHWAQSSAALLSDPCH